MKFARRPLSKHIAAMSGAFTLAAGLALAPSAAVADPNPYLQPDESWISISGTVDTVTRDSFTLDYGEGMVLVEMDDGDRDADAYQLLAGDKVTVSGQIDDDLFESTKIEASSVYVENLGTTFWASSADEESDPTIALSWVNPVVVSQAVVQGTVTAVDEDEFWVNTGIRAIEVDVDDLGFDPFDDEGYLKIEVGDVVKVVGEMDTELFDNRELDADYIVELYQG